ncbi:MAG: VOC family protein [Neobacillus sp.]
MQFSFDHLVWFFKKPEDVIPPLKQRGIHGFIGGRHESWGTYNSLIYFGLSYIEFLGIENLFIAEKHEDNRLITQIVEQLSKENREGPARIAVRTDQIEELAERLKEEGFTVYGPLPGERVRADGQVIRWSLLFSEYRANELSLPFFIQWEKSDEIRFSELEEQGLIGPYNVGNPKFESVGFVVHNLDQTLKTWVKLFNLYPSEEFIDSTINARCKKIELPGTKLLFCEPFGEGLAEKVLNEKGETPYLVTLTETNQNHFFEMLNGYWRLQ